MQRTAHEHMPSSYARIAESVYSIKLAHQIQIVLLQAIQSGFLKLEDTGVWHVIADLEGLGLFGRRKSLDILKKAVGDFIELLGRLATLYCVELRTEQPGCILSSECTPGESANRPDSAANARTEASDGRRDFARAAVRFVQ